ncbi:hypothetical protein DUI87_06614 [Hirundo rustica rustica]|uniref:Uncharacterized protein n=1 Tax=Hirundo rustica rustica TaxID=333673 RepID=A0A3M0KU57_HIRRU|nr:hypothetical protein DUI87_06614 [Hirundo rustica rustica]
MLRAGGRMFLTHYLLLLFLLALQAQNARTAPIPGHGAVVDTESAPSAPELEPDSMLIPSWYLKQSETVLGTIPLEGIDSVPGSHEEIKPIEGTSPLVQPEEFSGSAAGQKAETAGHCDPSKYYVLGTVAALALLLLGAVAGYIVMYQLLKRDLETQEDKERPGQVYADSSWGSHGQPRGNGGAKSGEGPGMDERAQASRFKESCHLFPEVFAAELAQLYKNMGADPSPLPTCPSCDLADSASSQDHWISLDSPQPTPSWCPCYQYQQEYFILEDDDYFSDSI